jgi:hypothetical protein
VQSVDVCWLTTSNGMACRNTNNLALKIPAPTVYTKQMTAPALVSCAVFMLGLAAGRILSLILDGMPHWLLVVYAALEIVLGLIAITLYRGTMSP